MNPLERVRARLRAGEAVVAGVLSGTSADGIDVGLARFPPLFGTDLEPPELVAFATAPFPADAGRRVREVLDGVPLDPAGVAMLSRDLGRAFGQAARGAADAAGLRLDLVGSHGQTVFHHDGRSELGRATLQLGDGAFVAEAAGAPVVADFRQADVAAGGEGAPLSALADELLFRRLARPAAILNLGGMANLTLLGERAEPIAFDTGPAGSLLDGLARRLLGAPFDRDGRAAAAGHPHAGLLDELARHPFLDRPPPKSTGRDTFGEAWVRGVAERASGLGVGPEDLLATAVELVALSVAVALERFGLGRPRELVVAGGGARNPTLVAALARRTGLRVRGSGEVGVDPDAREALVFAVLAARCVLGIPSTRTSVTGALAGRILGAIHAGPAILSDLAPRPGASRTEGAGNGSPPPRAG